MQTFTGTRVRLTAHCHISREFKLVGYESLQTDNHEPLDSIEDVYAQ